MKTPKRVLNAAVAHRRKLEKLLHMGLEGRHSKSEELNWTLLTDVADIIRLTNYLENNNVRLATELYADLDTMPREEVPVVIATFLERNIG
jgi:hypothetical protein